jgi:hypothetical protein
MSFLLTALDDAHVETGGVDGDNGESSPWPVSAASLSSGTRDGASTVRRHRVCAAALVAMVAGRGTAEIDNVAEVD